MVLFNSTVSITPYLYVIGYPLTFRLDDNSNWTTTDFGKSLSGLQTAIKIPDTFQLSSSTQFRVKAKNANGWSTGSVTTFQESDLSQGSAKSKVIGIIVGVAVSCLIVLIVITIIVGR